MEKSLYKGIALNNLFISSDIRRKRTKEDCYPPTPSKGL
jgi:hypothetical protein